MRRRRFITLLGTAAATWPLAARAQQAAAALVGYLSSFPAEANQQYTQAFRQGLTGLGLVEGRNFTIEYRWADQGQYDRLPTMAADLVGRRAAVLFASPINAALAAKAATSTIPVVFVIGSDPVDMGLTASLNRPGGNATGVTYLADELTAKRVELLRELAPKIASVGLLVNPDNPTTPMQAREMRLATAALGLQLSIVSASSQSNFDGAFERLVRERTDALMVSADSVFMTGRDQLVALATRHSMPAIYFAREFVNAGGLISYAASIPDSFRQAGTYVGRILKGEKPADLPVTRPTTFELVINLKTAKTLGLGVPSYLQQLADDVIE
jgi:putative ABC transport system substrate-binding protein